MLGLNALDQLANRHGDGLRPELRELLGRTAVMASGDKIIEFARFRGDGIVQAGPNPPESFHFLSETYPAVAK